MPRVESGFRQGVPTTVWRLDRSSLLRLMSGAVWPDRYAQRMGWIEEHVAPDGMGFVRVLLRNERSWPVEYEGEPDFCWRVMALVTPEHRGPCIFLVDVSDSALSDLSAYRVRWRRPQFATRMIIGENDLR